MRSWSACARFDAAQSASIALMALLRAPASEPAAALLAEATARSAVESEISAVCERVDEARTRGAIGASPSPTGAAVSCAAPCPVVVLEGPPSEGPGCLVTRHLPLSRWRRKFSVRGAASAMAAAPEPTTAWPASCNDPFSALGFVTLMRSCSGSCALAIDSAIASATVGLAPFLVRWRLF